MYMAHGSYGKARHLSSQYADLFGEYSDDQREEHDTGVQTDAFPYLNSQAEWNHNVTPVENINNSHSVNEPLPGSGALPEMSIEDSLMKLDIVSTIIFFFYFLVIVKNRNKSTHTDLRSQITFVHIYLYIARYGINLKK